MRLYHDVLHMLVAYTWPGNVRELINLLERLAYTPLVTPADLPPGVVSRLTGSPAAAAGPAHLGSALAAIYHLLAIRWRFGDLSFILW